MNDILSDDERKKALRLLSTCRADIYRVDRLTKTYEVLFPADQITSMSAFSTGSIIDRRWQALMEIDTEAQNTAIPLPLTDKMALVTIVFSLIGICYYAYKFTFNL